MENSQANTEAAVAAAQAKSQGDIQLEQVKAELQRQARLDEIEALKSTEAIKFTQIAKVETIKSILNKEGGSIEQVPAWALEGIQQTNALQSALLDQQAQNLVEQEQEEMAIQEQQMQEQMAMEEGGMMQEEQPLM